VVRNYIKHNMVPMVEQHDGTCEGAAESLEFIIDVWTDPQNVAWLNEFEEYVILNIANEWGPSERNQSGRQYWRDAYKEAVTCIRDAGINNMLVIDSPDYGQGPRGMEVYGRELLDHDPQHNIVFSIHMYGRTMNFWLRMRRIPIPTNGRLNIVANISSTRSPGTMTGI